MPTYRSPPPSYSSTIHPIPDTPPSLAYSSSSDDLIADIEDIMERQDVSGVMQKVLGHLNEVAEHLRQKDENEAANNIAKQTINIINIFMNATASWDIEQCLMNPSARPPATPNSAGRQVHNASPGGTWATIAATATPQNNALVKFHPSDSMRRKVTGNKDPASAFDLRVIWVQPWPANRPLPDATKPLSNYGALLSVAYSASDRAVCIIFQHAYQAQLLFDDNTACVRNKGFGIYGPNLDLMQGHPFPKNDDLRRMDPPLNDRRRLTFVRQALFTAGNGLSEDVFKKDIFGIVGEANVELVWLFNSGNATVVFSSTAIARMVIDNFRERAKKTGSYKGIQVSFSHDPCERPLHLVTQIPGAHGIMHPANHQGSTSYTPLGQARQISNAGGARPAPAIDNDGWQTVQRRK